MVFHCNDDKNTITVNTSFMHIIVFANEFVEYLILTDVNIRRREHNMQIEQNDGHCHQSLRSRERATDLVVDLNLHWY